MHRYSMAIQRAQLPEEYEPCAQPLPNGRLCGSTRRTAELGLAFSGIRTVCAFGHWNVWRPRSPWIPYAQFTEPTGQYYGLLSLPSSKKKRKLYNFGILGWRKTELLLHATCDVCRTPPYDANRNGVARKLFDWILEYRKELASSIVEHWQRTRSSPTFANWTLTLSQELLFEVSQAVRQSRLTADHGIPVYRLEKIAHQLDPELLHFARLDPTFAMCSPCNGGKGKRLTGDQLLSLWVNVYHDGDWAKARLSRRWEKLNRLLQIAELSRKLDVS